MLLDIGWSVLFLLYPAKQKHWTTLLTVGPRDRISLLWSEIRIYNLMIELNVKESHN